MHGAVGSGPWREQGACTQWTTLPVAPPPKPAAGRPRRDRRVTLSSGPGTGGSEQGPAALPTKGLQAGSKATEGGRPSPGHQVGVGLPDPPHCRARQPAQTPGRGRDRAGSVEARPLRPHLSPHLWSKALQGWAQRPLELGAAVRPGPAQASPSLEWTRTPGPEAWWVGAALAGPLGPGTTWESAAQLRARASPETFLRELRAIRLLISL